MTATWIIIGVTAVISAVCFKNNALFDRLSLIPYRVIHRKQWYRILSHMFVHADSTHLIINMLVLLSFGNYMEQIFARYHSLGFITIDPTAAYLILYFGGGIAATIHDLIRRRNNPDYTSVGASGGVSAVIFASIFLNPWNKLYIFGVIPIPGIIFGVIYAVYSLFMGGKRAGNINHYAHLYGALFGFLYPLILNRGFLDIFIENIAKI